jgi:hypothetical protein
MRCQLIHRIKGIVPRNARNRNEHDKRTHRKAFCLYGSPHDTLFFEKSVFYYWPCRVAPQYCRNPAVALYIRYGIVSDNCGPKHQIEKYNYPEHRHHA